MRMLLLLGALIVSASQATTISIPLTVTVVSPSTTAAGSVTVSVGAQSSIIPIQSVTPACGPAPPVTVAVQQCPTGSTGTWLQTTGWNAAPFPACWKAVLSPTAPPAGACTPIVTPPPPPPIANCGNLLGTAVIFCDTFDTPSASGGRAGQLNPDVWGASRTMGAGTNLGQQQYGMWATTALPDCAGNTTRVNPPNDIIICNGQLREASNDNISLQFDNGDVTALAMYPKQPFDFAGRSGTISVDVSNDTDGFHAAWPEIWVSDAPVPAPFNHFDSFIALPVNGFGVRLSANCDPGQQCVCPNGNNLNTFRWTVGSAVVSRNGTLNDSDGSGGVGPTVTQMDCVIASSGPGNMNHVELRVSQNEIDVYATDAGVVPTKANLRLIAKITNANLTLTRGLVWLEDVHYNADKGDPAKPSQRQHTFTWDNLAFDGPFTQRDFTFDAPDALSLVVPGATNLGKFSAPNAQATWTTSSLPANPQAAAVKVLFDFSTGNNTNPTNFTVTVNGNSHVVPWPYPDNTISAWRTLAVAIPATDLVAGPNVVKLGANTAIATANVDIVLAAVTGGVPVLPGSNNAYPQ
jgi:hypothetical protein